MAQRRHNFISGAAVLAFAVAVTKVLGALYKIPLGKDRGAAGAGYAVLSDLPHAGELHRP